jgi:hypothetical protein
MNWKKFKASNTLQDAQVVNLRALFEKPVLCLGVRAVSTNSLRGVWNDSCVHIMSTSSVFFLCGVAESSWKTVMLPFGKPVPYQ